MNVSMTSISDACMRCTKRRKSTWLAIWERNNNFHSVSMKFMTFQIMKSVIFTKLGLHTCQKKNKNCIQRDTVGDGNSLPFRVFRILFPRSTMAELNATINKSIVLQTYKMLNIEQLSKDKTQQ